MKVYVINAEGDQRGRNLQTLVGASPSKEDAQAECERLNLEASDGQDKQYEVVEVEVEPYAAAQEQAKAAKKRALEATRAAFFACCRELFEAHADIESFDLMLCDGGWAARAHGVGAVDGGPLGFVVVGYLMSFGYEDLKNLFGEDAVITVHPDGNIVRPSDDVEEDDQCLCPDCVVQRLENFFQLANLRCSDCGEWLGDPEVLGIRDVVEWRMCMAAELHWMSANADAVLDVLPSLEAEWPDNCESVRNFFARLERERGLAG